jgi:hypothetical protein
VPNAVEIEVKQDDFLLFCLRFYEDIYWRKTFNGLRIAREIIKEIEKTGIKYNPDLKQEME